MAHTISKAQVLALVFAAVLCVSVGEALPSAGMKHAGRGGASGLRLALAAAADWRVLCGTGLMATFYVLYALALSWADLSYVLPLTAVSYLLGAIFAHFFLGETVTMSRWIGTLLIVAGVVVVGRGG